MSSEEIQGAPAVEPATEEVVEEGAAGAAAEERMTEAVVAEESADAEDPVHDEMVASQAEEPLAADEPGEPDELEDHEDDDLIEEEPPGSGVSRPPLELSEDEVRSVVESLLFCADHPVTVPQLCAVFRRRGNQVRAPQVRLALQQLLEAYEDPERRIARGFQLLEIGGGFVLRTVVSSAYFVGRFLDQKPQRLSRAAMETLSVVAYRQPATRPQIDDVRGVDSSSALRALIERRLVKVLGKSEEVGRPLLYGTTAEFLEVFGIKSLAHLPTLQEFLELTDENQAKVDALDEKEEVKVSDLLAEDGHLVETETEEQSTSALQTLEVAVRDADRARKEVIRTLGPESPAEAEAPAEPEAQADGADPQNDAETPATAQDEESSPPPVELEDSPGDVG